MPRERSPNRDKAFQIYKENQGKITNREIANILNEDEKKVAVWKQRDKWNDKINVVQQKNESCTTKKTNKKDTKIKEPKQLAVTEIENPELTDKQRLFCIYYVKYFNATKAYQKAYGCDHNTAMVNGCKLLINTKVKDTIAALKADKLKGAMLEPGDILQKYIDIAFADITDFMEFGIKEAEIPDKKTGGITKIIFNYVDFKNSSEVDGTLISEVKQGKDGVSLKLQDKMKALDWLANHMDLLDTATKEKLDIEKQKLEIAKVKAGNGGDDEVEDDGFIEALKGEVAEVWADENTD